MSGVYASERTTAQTHYVMVAMDLQAKLLEYLMKEKRVPKKYRYFAVDVQKKADTLVDCVIASNCIMADNEKEKNERRLKLVENALCMCNQLQAKLICLCKVIATVTADSMEYFAKDLSSEIKLLGGLRKRLRDDLKNLDKVLS